MGTVVEPHFKLDIGFYIGTILRLLLNSSFGSIVLTVAHILHKPLEPRQEEPSLTSPNRPP